MKLKIIDNAITMERNTTGVALYRQPSPVDAFMISALEKPDGSSILFVQNDVGILFDQQRLMKLNPTLIQEWLGMARASSVDTSKMSDAQLIQGLKSRYIQSVTDVFNYTRALQADIDSEVSRIKSEHEAKLQAQQQAQQQTQQQAQQQASSTE